MKRLKLHVIVEQDEGGYYVAEVSALPGYFSQGITQEEAVSYIKEDIEGWLEVMESKHSYILITNWFSVFRTRFHQNFRSFSITKSST